MASELITQTFSQSTVSIFMSRPIPPHSILRFIQLISDTESILSSQTTQRSFKRFQSMNILQSTRANKFDEGSANTFT